MGMLQYLAKRYIAGTAIKDAIETARRLNAFGVAAAIANLGENVKGEAEAGAAVDEYVRLLQAIDESGVNSSISIKLTHLGLDVSDGLAKKNAGKILDESNRFKNSARIDMEGSLYTERAIEIFMGLRKRRENIGIAIQSSLLRSAGDVKRLIMENASVRLVKGAYKEPPDIAYMDKKDVDLNYERIMRELLLKGNMPAIATHDERLINEAIAFSNSNGIGKDRFEFEMLLGIKRTLQRRLAEAGYKVRVYVPYGRDWLPYTIRRFRERKENLFFVLRNILD
ncbi:MAG: proline dehydrogenase family protein [Deltaproteobacteria bacterium]